MVNRIMILLMVLVLPGCNSLDDASEDACANDDDCKSWQRCDVEIQRCIRQDTYQPCTIKSGQYDPCGVGMTCQTREGSPMLCFPRPFRIGLIEKEAQDGEDNALTMIIQYTLDNHLNPILQNYGHAAELIRVNHKTTDPQELQQAAKRLYDADVDVFLTVDSNAYEASETVFGGTEVLRLGRYNRRTDTVLEELTQSINTPLELRYDFSIAPITYNDNATIAHFSQQLGCRAITNTRLETRDYSRIVEALLKDLAPAYGMCWNGAIGVVNNTTNPGMVGEKIYDLNQANHCVYDHLVLPSLALQYLQRYQTLLEMNNQPNQSIFFFSDGLFRSQNTDYKLMVDFIRQNFRENSYFVGFKITNDAIDTFTSDFRNSFYNQTYQERCGSNPDCGLPTPESFDISAFRVAYGADLITMATIALFTTRLNTAPTTFIPHDATRDAFLDSLKRDPQHTSCKYPLINQCFSRLALGNKINFDGLSSQMNIAEDARMESLDEAMTFRTIPENWNGTYEGLTLDSIYQRDQMRNAYVNAPKLDGTLMCEK